MSTNFENTNSYRQFDGVGVLNIKSTTLEELERIKPAGSWLAIRRKKNKQYIMDEPESIRRKRRKGSYHLVASKNKLPVDEYDQEEDYLFRYLLEVPHKKQSDLRIAKRSFLQELARSGGDTSPSAVGVQKALETLLSIDQGQSSSSSTPSSQLLEGMWVSLSKPIHTDCKGVNESKEYLYSLGRMSFDIFQPSDLVCSIQGSFNPIHELDPHDAEQLQHIPHCLRDEIRNGHAVVRTYDTVTAFSIEPASAVPFLCGDVSLKSPNQAVTKPIEGLMTTYGYVIDNPNVNNRLSVWFTGGSIEIDQESQLQRWKDIFESCNLVGSHNKKPSKRFLSFWDKRRRRNQKDRGVTLAEGGMEDDGRLSYQITKPIGGHDLSYVDILYMDNTLRVMKANTGPIYVFARIPYFPDE